MIVVGAKETKHLFLYLFEKDTSMMWALGSVPLVSVFLQAFIYSFMSTLNIMITVKRCLFHLSCT